jgi:hypothetical protein
LAEEALELDWGNFKKKRHSADHLLQGTVQPPQIVLEKYSHTAESGLAMVLVIKKRETLHIADKLLDVRILNVDVSHGCFDVCMIGSQHAGL